MSDIEETTDQKSEKKPKTNEHDRAFGDNFEYTHDNPYHDRLAVFEEFVLRDDEAEANAGSWNSRAFKRTADLHTEIGTGYGHFMIDYTQRNPDVNFIGLDHRFKRSFHLAKRLAGLQFKSFKYLRGRGERLGHIFGENELTKIFYFFPDPWPKSRHHKKRLFQKRFLDEVYKVLKPGGEFLIKTDHDGYFDWMLDVMKQEKSDLNRFEIIFQTFDLRDEFPEHFLSSFITKFERIFLDKGIKIKAMVLKTKK
jgi:tRNA (guanine-N7-)-methyltransferase